ncbi:EI24 domain-containing protein [Oculatella sp. LEGE 06141]|uniref:EI24 domain-containing protein n=1 Tax=Oculatella sp. LEGE 06141 TaxID=1828648 RepID=UPI0018804357|nr:EI24 domain-containing protein [Oculatella sp. LEGE 06141]MBE9180290.1 EI24 domain-containing protein [Oculatella sp. LEGE 06141]
MSQEPPAKPIQLVRRGPGSIVVGATYPFRAFWFFVRQPNVRIYVLMPILINVVLGITLYAGLLFLGFRAIDTIMANLPTWAADASHWSVHLPDWPLNWPHWQINIPRWSIPWPNRWTISLPDWFGNLPNWSPTLPGWFANLPRWGLLILIGLLRVVLTFVLLLVTGFILLQFGVLLGSPWYGKLSEEIEKTRTGQVALIEVGLAQDVGRAVLYELKKLAVGLGCGMPLLLLGFFPGVGTLTASIGGILLAATLVCLDFLDSPLERRRLRFRQKLGVLWRSLPASASFGLVCFGLVSIPLINLLAIPLCVTAGTLFVCDRVLPELPSSKPS